MQTKHARHLSPSSPRAAPAEVELHEFMVSISRALPKLIRFIGSDVVRTHPVWGQAIPFHVPTYGSHASSGHCVRPDILMTDDGPKITEFDFVAGGLGCIPAALGTEQANEVLSLIEAWYRSMDVRRIRFATASTTTAASDCATIASLLQRRGWDAQAINIDTFFEEHRPKTVIHRMFYSAEMKMPQAMRHLPGRTVITAEPWLDTKAVFALVHDAAMTHELIAVVGTENLAFLRRAMPETWLARTLDPDFREAIIANRGSYVVKATDVETTTCWGSRSVIAGEQCSRETFVHAISGTGAEKEKFGAWPIVQRFHRSLDFRGVWNQMVSGELSDFYPITKNCDPKIRQPVREYVGAKFGVFLLIVNATDGGTCEIIPYSDTTMRTNRAIVDWSADAKPAVFKLS